MPKKSRTVLNMRKATEMGWARAGKEQSRVGAEAEQEQGWSNAYVRAGAETEQGFFLNRIKTRGQEQGQEHGRSTAETRLEHGRTKAGPNTF